MLCLKPVFSMNLNASQTHSSDVKLDTNSLKTLTQRWLQHVAGSLTRSYWLDL